MDSVDSFVFYAGWLDAIEQLPREDQLESLLAILRYGLRRDEYSGNGVASAILAITKPQIDINYRRRKNGYKGGKPKVNQNVTKSEPKANQDVTKREPNVNVNVNGNVNVKEEIVKEESKDQSLPSLSIDFDFPADAPPPEKKAKRFVKPSVYDVEAYCRERNNNVNPEAFINFYESKGWRVGNQPMKDWKAAVRTWEQKDNRYGNSNKNRTTFEERNFVSHDFNESDGTI